MGNLVTIPGAVFTALVGLTLWLSPRAEAGRLPLLAAMAPRYMAPLRRALEAFVPTLPPGAIFSFDPRPEGLPNMGLEQNTAPVPDSAPAQSPEITDG